MTNVNKSEVKKFAFDISLTFISNIFNMLTLFLITIFVGKFLGPEDLGLYRIVSTIYAIATLISSMGMPNTMVKYVAESKNDAQKLKAIISSGIISSLMLGSGAILIFFMLAEPLASVFNMPKLANLIKLLSIVFPFSLCGSLLLGILNGFREIGKFALGNIFHNFLMVVVTGILIFFDFGVEGAVLGLIISGMGGCLFTVIISKKLLPSLSLVSFATNTKSILSFGGQTFIGDAINIIIFQADIIFIGLFLSAKDVGIYSVAAGLSKFFWLIPNAINTITYPAVSEYWAKKNISFLNKMINKSMQYTACTISLLALGVGFFTESIITIFFGAEFIAASRSLIILIIGVSIFGIFMSIRSTLAGAGRPDLAIKANSVGAVLNIILNISLIPILGIAGAAISTTISLICVAIISIFFIHKTMFIKIGIRWYVKLMFIIFILIILFIIGMGKIDTNLLKSAILIVYIAMIFIFILNNDDKKTLKQLFCSIFKHKENLD